MDAIVQYLMSHGVTENDLYLVIVPLVIVLVILGAFLTLTDKE